MKHYVLITGAAGGLGKAFAVECASRGWDVFLTDLNEAALTTLARSLSDTYGVSALTQTCDLTSAEQRSAFYNSLRTNNLRFWALINVAGMDYEGLFYQRTRQEIQTIVRLNIEGTLDLTHAMLDLRDLHQTFRILNVASLAAFYPMPVKATYAASKRFLLDFSLALREELHDLGVSVTVLCPAGLPTTPETVEAIEAQGLMGVLTTQDIGAVASGALDAALKGKAIYIPGALNRFIQAVGSLAPARLVAYFIGRRWQAAHRRRDAQKTSAATHQVLGRA